MDEQEKPKQQPRVGGVGRMAGKLVKNAGPNARRLIDEGRPKLEKAIEETRPALEKALKAARPRVAKAVEDYRPKVEQAGREAVRYAQDHQDEIAALAMKGVRMRLGPLGMAVDALGIGTPRPGPQAQPIACPACGTSAPAAAKFCSHCGASFAPPAAPPR